MKNGCDRFNLWHLQPIMGKATLISDFIHGARSPPYQRFEYMKYKECKIYTLSYFENRLHAPYS